MAADLEQKKQELRQQYGAAIQIGNLTEDDIDRMAREQLGQGPAISQEDTGSLRNKMEAANAPEAPEESDDDSEDLAAPSQPQAPTTTPPIDSKPKAQAAQTGGPNKKAFEVPKTPEAEREKLRMLADLKGKLSPEQQEMYEGKIKDWQDKMDQSDKLFNERETRTQWLEAADVMGQALTKLAAGYYGMKTGYDMSGVQFNKHDWSKDLDRLYDQYDKSTSRGLKQKEMAEREYGNAQTAATRAGDRERKAREEQFRQEDTEGRKAGREYEAAKVGAEKFNASEENKFGRQENKDSGAEDKQAAKADADLLKQKNHAGQSLMSIMKAKKDTDKADQLRSFLQTKGITPEEIKKTEKGSDWIYTSDKEKADRLAERAAQLVKDMPESKKGGASAPSAAPSNGPKPGTVQNGYRFKGGDPADQNNWERI